jgi:hypothetical protein
MDKINLPKVEYFSSKALFLTRVVCYEGKVVGLILTEREDGRFSYTSSSEDNLKVVSPFSYDSLLTWLEERPLVIGKIEGGPLFQAGSTLNTLSTYDIKERIKNDITHRESTISFLIGNDWVSWRDVEYHNPILIGAFDELTE